MNRAMPQAPEAGRQAWSGRTRGGVFGNWVFAFLVRWVSLRTAYALLFFVATYFVFFAPKARRASMEFLVRAGTGETGGCRVWLKTWRHFYAFGQTLLDRTAGACGKAKRFTIALDGREHLESVINAGQGAVIVGAHFGNWELASSMLATLGTPLAVVAMRGELPHVQRFLDSISIVSQYQLIEADRGEETSLAILAALRSGALVIMQGDRAVGQEQVRLPFLGRDAWFPLGPYMIAAAAGAPVMHTFARRTRTFHYEFRAFPPEYPILGPRGARTGPLRENAQRFVARLEHYARQAPCQWSNFYPFWDEATAGGAASGAVTTQCRPVVRTEAGHE